MRTAHIKPRESTIKRNEWEGILGRLDVLADEINRALGRATRIEEPMGRSGVLTLYKMNGKLAGAI